MLPIARLRSKRSTGYGPSAPTTDVARENCLIPGTGLSLARFQGKKAPCLSPRRLRLCPICPRLNLSGMSPVHTKLLSTPRRLTFSLTPSFHSQFFPRLFAVHFTQTRTIELCRNPRSNSIHPAPVRSARIAPGPKCQERSRSVPGCPPSPSDICHLFVFSLHRLTALLQTNNLTGEKINTHPRSVIFLFHRKRSLFSSKIPTQ